MTTIASPIVAPDGPWKQTASRKAFSLIDPQPEDIDFDVDIAGPLSRLARFTGDIRGGAYSVAQHCVVGADWLHMAGCDASLCACFLLHDAHEAYIGDISTPARDAISWVINDILDGIGLKQAVDNRINGCMPSDILKFAVRRLKDDLDAAIYSAAGLDDAEHEEADPRHFYAGIIHNTDLLMLAAEVDAFLGGEVVPWDITTKLRAKVEPPTTSEAGIHDITCLLRETGIWSAERAETEYQTALRRYLPARFPKPAFAIEE